MSNRLTRVLTTTTACLGLLLFCPAAAWADDPKSPTPMCTIVGTTGEDVLRGTADDDVICGLAGDDVIVGMGGDDILRGGPGDDLLVGGPGTDQLHGEDGEDRLIDIQQPSTEDGGPGDDLCVAAMGSVISNCERQYAVPGRDAGTR